MEHLALNASFARLSKRLGMVQGKDRSTKFDNQSQPNVLNPQACYHLTGFALLGTIKKEHASTYNPAQQNRNGKNSDSQFVSMTLETMPAASPPF